MLKLDAVVEAEHPHKAAWRGSKAVAMELGEGDDVAPWQVRFSVIRWRHDPFRPRRGNVGAQKPLLLQVPQPALIVSDDESHGHLGRRWKVALRSFSLEGALRFRKARGCRRAGTRAIRNAEETAVGQSLDIYRCPTQWADPTNAVTPSVNAPHNGPLPLSDRTLRIQPTELCRNGSLLKRRTRRARKQTAMTLPSTAR